MSVGYTLVNPATEEALREIVYTTAPELAQAVARARDAQRAWRRVPVAERVRVVGQMVPAFRAMADQVALDITRQMGKPLQESRNEINTMIDRAETMGRLAEAALADEPLPPKEGFTRFIHHEPLGVVLDIAAWNYPLLIAVNVIVRAPGGKRGPGQARASHPALRRPLRRGVPPDRPAPRADRGRDARPRRHRHADPLGSGGLRVLHGVGRRGP